MPAYPSASARRHSERHSPAVAAAVSWTVIEIARGRGFEVVERHIPGEELGSFSEVFICGTAAEVTPVPEIGEHKFRPGNISLSLMDDYAKLVRRELQMA